MSSPNQTLRLVLVPSGARAGRPATALIDWIRQHPDYRTKVRGGDDGAAGRSGLGDAAIIAVVAQGALLGLFQLLKTWVMQQRTEASVRVKVRGSTVEVKVSARADPAALVEQLTRAVGAVTEGDAPDQRGTPG